MPGTYKFIGLCIPHTELSIQSYRRCWTCGRDTWLWWSPLTYLLPNTIWHFTWSLALGRWATHGCTIVFWANHWTSNSRLFADCAIKSHLSLSQLLRSLQYSLDSLQSDRCLEKHIFRVALSSSHLMSGCHDPHPFSHAVSVGGPSSEMVVHIYIYIYIYILISPPDLYVSFSISCNMYIYIYNKRKRENNKYRYTYIRRGEKLCIYTCTYTQVSIIGTGNMTLHKWEEAESGG